MKLPGLNKGFLYSALRWTGQAVAGAIILSAIIIIGTYLAFKTYLPPDRLIKLVEEYAPEFINGDVKLGHLDVSFRKTFPDVTIEIDSLILTSKALERLPEETRAQLPEWGDTVLTLSHFKGTVNIDKLRHNELALYDVILEKPSLNLLTVNDSIANYDIILPSDDEDSFLDINSFSIDHFRLSDSGPLRYYSMSDSINGEIRLTALEIDGSDLPRYEVSTKGGMGSSMLETFGIQELAFAFNGGVTWDFENGCRQLTVTDFLLSTGDTDINISTAVDFGDTIVINSLKTDITSIPYETINHYMTADTGIPDLNTDLTFTISGELTKPYVYVPGVPTFPHAIVTLEIPQSYIRWPQHYLNINKLILQSKLTLDGDDLNNSVLEVQKFLVDGNAIDIDMKGIVSRPLSDPRIAGEIKGRIFIDRLPSALLSMIPGDIGGTIGMNTAFRFKKSQLTPNGFHKIYLNGAVSLRELRARFADSDTETGQPDTLAFYTPLTMLRFDSNKSVVSNGVTVDSLLSLVLTSDSLYYRADGLDVRLRNLRAAVGSKNIYSSADTTRINPFGGSVSVDRLLLDSYSDSTRLFVAGLTGKGSLSRFEGQDRVPLLNLNLGAKGIGAGTPSARIMVRDPEFTLTANVNPRRTRRRGPQSAADSVLTDSVRMQRRHRQTEMTSEDSVSIGLRNLLNRWNVKGELTASRARMFTSAFPLSNTVSDIDLYFTTDSIQLRSMRLKAGRSDFSIKGAITDIRQSMRRHDKRPLKIRFGMQSDTIDIDELSHAIFVGAAATPDTAVWDTGIDVTTDVADVISVDTANTAAFLVPADIDADLRFRAKNVIYTGLLLHDFKGTLDVWDRAIHLHDLQALSDMGSIDVSALYNAPDAKSLTFGMGMELKDFHLDKFLKVTPAIGELLPSIKDFSGIINADIAMTTNLEPNMDFEIPSVKADIKIDGDSLVLLDADTFKSLSKWLLFKDKKHNMIDHMGVEIEVDSGQIIIYPFIFNIDRYKLGVMGSNDIDMNLNYHVSVLKSPMPFKFGINITGDIDNMKIRLGGAKIKENTVVERLAVNSDTRINLIQQLEGIFRRGANSSRGNGIQLNHDHNLAHELKQDLKAETDTLSAEHLEVLKSDTSEQSPEKQ